MRKVFLVLLLFSILISVQQAEAIGLAHGELKHDFAPDKEIVVKFQSLYYENADNLAINISGELLEYSTLSEISDDGAFSVTVQLPSYLDTPGTHMLYVSIYEDKPGSGTVGVDTRVVNRIQVLVPYDGIYLRILGFSADNIVQGADGLFKVTVDNIGKNTIEEAYTKIEVYDNLTKALITTLESEKVSLGSFEGYSFKVLWENPPNKNSIYNAKATVYFDGQSTQSETTFHIGELLVDIAGFSETVPQSRTSPFDINLESKWNSEITDVYASVQINGEEFRSYPADITAWGEQTVTAYIDASELEIGQSYPVEITIFYEGETSTRSGEIEIVPSSGFELDATNMIYIAIAVVLIVVIYLLKRLNINISFKKKK
jgi:hypothetical protein